MDKQNLQALLQPDAYPHPVHNIELVETHISWVLLTGDYAYKIKKPVDFGFLDFSSLEKRKYYCEQEVALNRRFAPELYLDIVPITSPPVRIGGEGITLDYCVRMAQFDREQILDRLATRGALNPKQQRQLGVRLADFHRRLESEPRPAARYGSPDRVIGAVQQNFDQIRTHLPAFDQSTSVKKQLALIEQWSKRRFDELEPLLRSRRATGFIRDCHGDLHLGNIALIDAEVVFFDCIEFNPDFRLIDVMSELAFLLMDLEARQLPEAANRVLNTYLEHSGDFAGLALLTFYKVYRAMVRAKVSVLEIAGEPDPEQHPHYPQFLNYLQLAQSYTRPRRPGIAITHGLSGSGKSTVAAEIAARYDAIRLRSDVERKRLFGLAPEESSDKGIYSRDATEKTFHRLRELVEEVTHAGFNCIVDATFLHRRVRQTFADQAQSQGMAFHILDCRAPREVMEQRLRERAANGDDASEATVEIMHRQQADREPLQDDELTYTHTIDTTVPLPDDLAILGLNSRSVNPL